MLTTAVTRPCLLAPAATGRCRGRPGRRVTRRAEASPASKLEGVDYKEIGNLFAATAFESGAIASALYILQQVMQLEAFPGGVAPKAFVWVFFLFISLRARVFGLLDSRRPKATGKDQRGFGDRKRPDWCPPGPVFAVVWSTIAGLRATSAILIWETLGCNLFVLPLIMFGVHLSIGDTWNYINNAEKQLGFSVVFNFCFVWTSAVLTNVLYFQTYETAGWVLLPMCVWLTVAAKLVRDIRAINGKEPLLPRVSAISNIPP